MELSISLTYCWGFSESYKTESVFKHNNILKSGFRKETKDPKKQEKNSNERLLCSFFHLNKDLVFVRENAVLRTVINKYAEKQ